MEERRVNDVSRGMWVAETYDAAACWQLHQQATSTHALSSRTTCKTSA
jgi:hypothetical protein